MSRFQTTDPIFASEEPLREHYEPDTLHSRDEELDDLAQPLQPVVNGDAPRNIIVHGNEGTGKSVAVRTILDELQDDVDTIPDVEVTVVTVQCRHLSSTYQLAIRILNTLRNRREETPVSETGHSTSTIYSELFDEFDAIGGVIILVLDEFDEIESGRDEFLRNIPRALSERTVTESKPGITITSNSYQIVDSLAPETRDSLNAELVSFDPYSADELTEILRTRARAAFNEGVVAERVISHCAAIAAKQSGSARLACQLLYKPGLLARDDDDAAQVQQSHVEDAQTQLESEYLINGLAALDTNAHLALISLLKQSVLNNGDGRTANVYDYYVRLAEKYGFEPLSKRNMQKRLTSMTRKGYVEKTNRKDDGNYNQYSLAVDLDLALQGLQQADDEIADIAAELYADAEDQHLITRTDEV